MRAARGACHAIARTQREPARRADEGAPKAAPPAAQHDEAPGPATPRPEALISCRRCRAALARPADIFQMESPHAVQVFVNPYGYTRPILTVREARGLVLYGAPSTDFTWFEGYAWTVAGCAGCGQHVGWRYDTTEARRPGCFVGFLLEAILLPD